MYIFVSIYLYIYLYIYIYIPRQGEVDGCTGFENKGYSCMCEYVCIAGVHTSEKDRMCAEAARSTSFIMNSAPL
jgi:hypothetical protein